MSVWLLRYMPSGRGARVHLRLAGYGGSQTRLEVTVLDATGSVLRSQVLERGTDDRQQETFWCSEGVLWLPMVTKVIKDGTGIGTNSTQKGLQLAQDGTLLGVHRSAGVALIGWVVPIALSHDIWFRWPAVDERRPPSNARAQQQNLEHPAARAQEAH
ncbi:hypothetical protein [Cupriavidus respiraculi]|nr:hypothetical protein [Cupriavidus respiraculi]MBY4949567.1 hypothetical protein [Cupriavidus respiraculi]